jgi:RNA polymerase sigma-70 factor (ECF subfamily)
MRSAPPIPFDPAPTTPLSTRYTFRTIDAGGIAVKGLCWRQGVVTGWPSLPDVQERMHCVPIDVNYRAEDENRFILAAQGGDRHAFAQLIEQYWDRLYRWLCRLTRDTNQAEDLTQETFLKAFAGLGSFRAGSNFRAWLFRIGHNNFVNQRRSARHITLPLSPELAETPIGPVGEAITRETIQAVNEAVRKLAPDFQAPLLLRIDEGLSFQEIAEILQITEETARWRVFKARKKLLDLLSPDLLSTMSNEPKPS